MILYCTFFMLVPWFFLYNIGLVGLVWFGWNMEGSTGGFV